MLGHPKGLYVLFMTEMWERFSFYTMRAILVLYLAGVVFSDLPGGPQVVRDRALEVYGTYLLLVYLSGLGGGYFADKVLGSRKAIFIGGLVMGAGLFVMMAPQLVFYGLGLVIAGNGFFKPNISTIVSGLYGEQDSRRDGAFTIFYMGINIGAFLAIFSAGWAESIGNWNIGFVIAGIGMIVSLFVFGLGQKHLGTAGFPPNRTVTVDTRLGSGDFRDIALWAAGMIGAVLGVVFLWNHGLAPLWEMIPGFVKLAGGILLIIAAFGGFVATNRDNSREEWERIISIVILSVFVIFFWAGFEQAGGTMNLFAYEQTDRHIFGWEMPATWFQGVNPFFIVLLAPLFSMLWGRLDRSRFPLSTPAKMGVGMIVLGIGFIVMYFGEGVAEQYGKAGMGWLVAVYLLHTMGELCLSPIGLSMVTKLSPVRRVSLMMGVWFACTAIADYLSGRLEAITHAFGINLWATLIATSIGAGVLLLFLTPMLKKWMHGRA
ncbi:MAG TPA: peptide MFS transporter [bacterium]|nr:peptide MFS transporter [bacterium]